jgi:hypothetical protein
LSKKKGIAKPAKEGLVIDSSIAIAWCFPDEQDAYSQSVLDALASEPALVPEPGIARSPALWSWASAGNARRRRKLWPGWASLRSCPSSSMTKPDRGLRPRRLRDRRSAQRGGWETFGHSRGGVRDPRRAEQHQSALPANSATTRRNVPTRPRPAGPDKLMADSLVSPQQPPSIQRTRPRHFGIPLLPRSGVSALASTEATSCYGKLPRAARAALGGRLRRRAAGRLCSPRG